MSTLYRKAYHVDDKYSGRAWYEHISVHTVPKSGKETYPIGEGSLFRSAQRCRLRYRNCTKMAVLMCEEKPSPILSVWCRRTRYPVQ